MNTFLRRIALALLVVSGLFVGLWATAAPRSFYDNFPSLGFHWIDIFGPFNEHLVFDVGALQVALAAGSLAAIFSRSALPGRLSGLTWFAFGLPHFIYHVSHLGPTTADSIGQALTTSLAALLGLLLLIPARARVEAVNTELQVKEMAR